MNQLELSQKLHISRCFSLEDKEKEILKILAKFGPSNISQIDGHSGMTRRQIEYSLKNYLTSYVKIHSKKPYRNITKAFQKSKESGAGHEGGKKLYETIFTLNEKGWIASVDLIPIEENYFLNYHLDRCPKNKQKLLREYVKTNLQKIALNLNLFNVKLDSLDYLGLFLNEASDWEYALEEMKTQKIALKILEQSHQLRWKIEEGDDFLKENHSPLIEKIMRMSKISSLKKLPLIGKISVFHVDTGKTVKYTLIEYEKLARLGNTVGRFRRVG